jgi:hypothetical protein
VVTEEHWSIAASELKRRRDQLNGLVSALHRRRANGMTAYEAFGRVIADRARVPDVELTWPAGTTHTPDDLAKMREICADIRTALEAVGDPASHPLKGIEQTKWSPAWVHALQQGIDRLNLALRGVRAAADDLVLSIDLGDAVGDDASLPQLIRLVSLMLHASAADGALLLSDEAPERVSALYDLADAVGRLNEKNSELSVRYDLRVTLLDLSSLEREWADACASNLLVRSGRKKKVRSALKPYCAGEVPEDIGRDLVTLQDLADLLRDIEDMRPRFRDLERLWRGAQSDVSRYQGLIDWAASMRDAVDACLIDGVAPERLLAHVQCCCATSPASGRAARPVKPSRRCTSRFRRCSRRPKIWAHASVSTLPKTSSESRAAGSKRFSNGPRPGRRTLSGRRNGRLGVRRRPWPDLSDCLLSSTRSRTESRKARP